MNQATTLTNDAAGAGSAAAEHLHVDADAIARIGTLATAAAAVRHVDAATFLVLPPEFTAKSITAEIEAASDAPNRKRGTVALSSVDSFKTFILDQGLIDSSYIYADPDKRTLTAVLNEHVHSAPVAGWRDFRAVYTAELSREFDNWLRNDKKIMEQEEFAIFLEDNIADIVEPSGDVLHAVALTLQAKTEVAFSSHRRLDNGQVQLGYSESITATAGGAGNIDIPREFAIGVRLFKNGEGYKVRARLKYRLGNGKVKFWYELDRAENVIEEAFDAYIDAATASGFTVLRGKP